MHKEKKAVVGLNEASEEMQADHFALIANALYR